MIRSVLFRYTLLITIFIMLLVSQSILAQDSLSVTTAKKYEYGVSAGMIFPAKIKFSDLRNEIRSTNSLLIKGYIDKYLLPEFMIGLYLNFSYSNLEEIDEYEEPYLTETGWKFKTKEDITEHKATVFEIGASFKTKFVLSPSWLLKPGLHVGYRQFYFHYKAHCGLEMDDAHGLAINGSAEFQYLYSENIILFAETGFLTQPYGGKEDITYMDFG
ncbi:MAG: hypothetical protein P8078_03385, partial [bacterium]